jgi:hypothetical protein
MGTESPSSAPLRLRNLPLAARLVLSAFLISVGCGYAAALVQLHFQHASPGNPLPTRDDVVRRFYGALPGEKPKCKMHCLLEADENLPFNGGGQMRAAFFEKAGGWKKEIDKRAHKMVRRAEPNDEQRKQAEEQLRNERETERLALVEWVEKGGDKEAYEKDSFCVSDKLVARPIDDQFVGDAPESGGRTIKVQTLINERCVRCHAQGGQVEKAPLENYAQIQKYLKVEEVQPIPRDTLVQSTHVHLLSFSLLYGLTGLIFAFTSLPAFVRFIIAPLPLVAQLIDIACWWLTRVDPRFADGIIISGGVVAGGLMLHIALSLFNMYGKTGKTVLLLLLVAIGVGSWQVKERYVDPFLASEKAPAAPAVVAAK